ncbi:MAG: molybdopterin-dependent oxidoreductase [Acidimicrobiales bacterium]
MTSSDTTSSERNGASSPWLPAAIAGLVAGGLALAAGELVASLAAPQPGPVTGVANRVVDSAPTWFVNFGKDLFGLADKPALVLGTIIISVAIAAVLGVTSRSRRWIGRAGFAAFGVVGALAIGVDAQGGWLGAIVTSVAAVAAGVGALELLLGRLQSASSSPSLRPAGAVPIGVTESPTNPAVGRRSFLAATGVVGAVAVAGGAASRSLRGRSSVEVARDDARSAVQASAGGEAANVQAKIDAVATSEVASTPGITPIVISGEDFYRIDTALLVPQVDPATWTFTIKGMVENELTFTYDELLARATTIETVTLSCVSNEVGGGLVGNAVWQGIPLTELLDEAGVLPGATQIKSTSVDGWDCGFPTAAAYDGRTSLLAVGMNDEPLPVLHGFPARLVVSGLYGYVSATKWIESIELTTLEDFDGYWIPRGWSKLGPIKTQSRIDTPRRNQTVPAGTTPIAGVAWAPNTGIEKVEIRIDGGDWLEASLGESLGPDAWRQWVLNWDATSGDHRIEVRATDSSGYTQTDVRTDVAPDGATGWHTIDMTVA